jgi:transposase
MEKIGIDVHKVASQVCIRTEDGAFVEQRIATTREAFAKHLGGRARARVLVEASTESEWVARCLEALGHEVIVADPNFAPMYATRSRKIKTDRRDARALCEACALGAYRAAHRRSDAACDRRAQVAVRAALVSSRTKYISLARALARQEGCRIGSGSAGTFVPRAQAQELPAPVRDRLAPLLTAIAGVTAQLTAIDKALAQAVRADVVAQRFCTAPGIGPVTALTFEAVVDNVARFGSAKEVRAYVGLVPREQSSGEQRLRGRITKAGNARLRTLLVEAAWSILRYQHEATRPLRAWALRIAGRRGKRIAAVALARKLAGILYAMWRDGSDFGQPARRRTAVAA